MDATPYGVVHFFPGGTKEQYEASLAAVHPGEGLPAGGPDLPRRRLVCGWLDHHGRPRIEGELGDIPGHDPHAPDAGGH